MSDNMNKHHHGTSAVDPVCGMNVEVTPKTLTDDLEGETYHFC
ncbi:hypothetical protein NIG5292_00826 [Nereida ignava]|uniref:Copper-transporting P-type ATPase n=1 Tax=Nereida ignava TaxID=282199 RepID=A0A0U1NJS7_9RHOB|nr:hypothetical protein [Nereida ignava]CRK74789.1 hypothetical protein NIG5292_00826 [Nereida ignava]SFJ87149.1 hypothetical protein SAMN02745667_02635 [Nereida ignava DSM 16309]